MYCVKCGVRLEEGTSVCPLCGTPVVDPSLLDQKTLQKAMAASSGRGNGTTAPAAGPHYDPGLYPVKERSGAYVLLAFITTLMLTAALSTLFTCLAVYHSTAWSGYVCLGLAFVYTAFVLPFWFSRPHLAVFVPTGFAAAIGYLLYLSVKSRGGWFLSFAFPVMALVFLFTYLAIGLVKIRFTPKVRLMLTGIYLVLLGSSSILVEFFSHLTFGQPMFVWSLYPTVTLGLIGIAMAAVSFIRPVRTYLHKKLFI